MVGVRRYLKEAGRRISDLLWPRNIYCICCGDTIDPEMPYSLCGRCVREIHWIPVEIRTDGGEGTEPHIFRRGISCARYETRTKEILGKLKYQGKPGIAVPLAELMLARAKAAGISCELAVPVPMYRKKERIRGYNQAALLAEQVAGGLGIACETGILKRKAETGAMSALSAEERRLNLRNAFEAFDPQGLLTDRSVLLVDDIMTTGTTADECAAALLTAGAAEVNLLVFASGNADYMETELETDSEIE